MAERLDTERIEKLLNKCNSYDSVARNRAGSEIRESLRSAYLEADESVFLREVLDDLNRRLIDAELERDRLRVTVQDRDSVIFGLRQAAADGGATSGGVPTDSRTWGDRAGEKCGGCRDLGPHTYNDACEYAESTDSEVEW